MARNIILPPGVRRNSIFGREPIATLAALGNSWYANAITSVSLPFKHTPSAVYAMLRGRVYFGPELNFGYSGATSTTIVTHIPELIAALGGRGAYVLIEMLINDSVNSVPDVDWKANIDAAIKQLNDAGCVPIFQTVPPRSDGNNTTAIRNYNNRVSDYLREKYRVAPGGTMHVAEVAARMVDYTSVTGAPEPVMLGDGVHPLDYGIAKAVAPAFYEILDKLLPPASPYAHWQTTNFDRTDYPTGWRAPRMTGTSGNIVSGGSGVLADNLSLSIDSGSMLNAVCSKVSGTGYHQEYQKLVLGALGTGSAREQISLSFNITPAVGDSMFALADIEFSNLSNVLGVFVSVNANWTGANDSGTTNDYLPASGVWMPTTPRFTVSSTTALTYRLNIAAKCNGAAPTGTIIVKLCGFKYTGIAT